MMRKRWFPIPVTLSARLDAESTSSQSLDVFSHVFRRTRVGGCTQDEVEGQIHQHGAQQRIVRSTWQRLRGDSGHGFDRNAARHYPSQRRCEQQQSRCEFLGDGGDAGGRPSSSPSHRRPRAPHAVHLALGCRFGQQLQRPASPLQSGELSTWGIVQSTWCTSCHPVSRRMPCSSTSHARAFPDNCGWRQGCRGKRIRKESSGRSSRGGGPQQRKPRFGGCLGCFGDGTGSRGGDPTWCADLQSTSSREERCEGGAL
mmetsp:Transcript_11152/g.68696  ORF Transcript_11152/g.68696 Transcript_11152/m.68696 type:complete len:257 (+) Transcript_11152:3469-4239(+)